MIIRDEIHGTIEFNELEERIIDSDSFQRLRRVKQMSVTNLVYPGANHTRFEHSLGTAHLAWTIAGKLELEEDEARKIKLYGLLHDIGHTAFSHEGEDVLKKYLGDHEKRGSGMIKKGEIADLLSENYRPSEIAELDKTNLGAIVTSDLGADRMDYLKRDALNTGVAYGIIDIDRVVHTLAMENGEVCIEKGGLEAAEFLLVARFMMFSAVYMHKTVRIATAMLYRAIEGSIEDGSLGAEQFLELGDESALALMSESKKGGSYARALLGRRLYKEVYSFPRGEQNQATAEKLEKALCKKLGCDILVDYPHAFFKPVAFKVKTRDGLKPINRISSLVQSLREAEEERMKVLVLAEEEIRKRMAQRIRKEISNLLPC